MALAHPELRSDGLKSVYRQIFFMQKRLIHKSLNWTREELPLSASLIAMTQLPFLSNGEKMISLHFGMWFDWFIDWLNDWLIDWLIDRFLIDWWIDWLTDWLIDWLTDWLNYWLSDCWIVWMIDSLNRTPSCAGQSVLHIASTLHKCIWSEIIWSGKCQHMTLKWVNTAQEIPYISESRHSDLSDFLLILVIR